MSTLVAAFGALALALAIVGIYGVMSYSVTERTRELAIRRRSARAGHDVLGLVVGKAICSPPAASAAGLLAAVLLGRTIAGLLFGVGA